MKKILVVDRDEIQNKILRNTLENDYELLFANSLSDAIDIFETEVIDFCIMELHLPDGSALNFCSRVRNSKQNQWLPIFIISANADTYNKLSSLELGADDYITKPLFPAEIRLKLRNYFRRLEQKNEVLLPKNLPFHVNTKKRTIYIVENHESRALDLTSKEYDLLLTFLINVERVFSRQELLDLIWSKDHHVVDRVIDTHISILRKKISPYSKCLCSEYGSGYKFVAPEK
tara:strand:+ start:1796 stop:2488 length:693 start_codon:yes stop_codon:yes gene_type:complete